MMQLIHLLVTKSHTSFYKTHAFRGQCVSCDRTKADTKGFNNKLVNMQAVRVQSSSQTKSDENIKDSLISPLIIIAIYRKDSKPWTQILITHVGHSCHVQKVATL